MKPKYFLITTVLILNFITCIYSQKSNTADLISVKTYIVGRGAEYYKNNYVNDRNNYFSLINVTNNQDTAISFMIMSASWAIDNFVVDNDSIYLKYIGNDANIPVKIKLESKKSVKFTVILRFRNASIINKYFKVGFSITDINDFNSQKKKRSSGKVYWSNKVKLEYSGIKYEIEE